MNPLIATHYSTGDAVEMLAMLIVPIALAVATFCFAAVVWKRRKELGFLVLAIGVGLQAITVFISTFSRWQGQGMSSAMLNYAWLFKLPAVISLIGWVLLARRKNQDA